MAENKPQYMIIYRCTGCGKESGFTEKDVPVCRFCHEGGKMEIVSKQEITPEVIAARLKTVTDSMFSNLLSAFESMTEEDKARFPKGTDPEKQMLELLAKAKSLKEKIQALELKDPGKEEKRSDLS